MITARVAAEQGRTVFAVPGRIDSHASQGCHALIRGGATLVTRVEDVLADFEFALDAGARLTQAARRAGPAPALTEQEAVLVGHLEGGEMDVDDLIRLSGQDAGAVGAALVALEIKRAVRMLPGRRVAKVL
jgi:DNA processing protein